MGRHVCKTNKDACNGNGVCAPDKKAPRGYKCACNRMCSGDRCENCLGRPTTPKPTTEDHVCDTNPNICNGKGKCIKRQNGRYVCACVRLCSGKNCENCFIPGPVITTSKTAITVGPVTPVAPRQCSNGMMYSNKTTCRRRCNKRTSAMYCKKGCVCPPRTVMIVTKSGTRCAKQCPKIKRTQIRW